MHSVGQPGKAGRPVQSSCRVAAVLQVLMAKGWALLVGPGGWRRLVYLTETVGWEVIFVKNGAVLRNINCFSGPSWVWIS